MKAHYQRGGLGDSIVKKRLLDALQAFLEPIRKKREEFAKDPQHVMQILFKGTERANAVASETLRQVRKAMRLDYL